ncbi:MAG: hypothetical protein KatS3mg124_0989 [Porticoccaceae bacterium]|nr:MAG: hypothetical protein KatS3mg124_0989 [Porticoccaceae bacterium]
MGIGAIKYADLSKTRTHDYRFDWDAMLSFEGNTAPYLQYAYTRIRSLFRRAGRDPGRESGPILPEVPEERQLALGVVRFEEVLEQVAREAFPHLLCHHLYALAGAFMTFYERCPILHEGVEETVRDSRLALADAVGATLAKGLELLGIEVMERM